MKKKQYSIVSKFLNSTLIIIFVSLGLLCLIWFQNEFSYFQSESESLRSNHIENQKMLIKKEVEQTVQYINKMSSLSEERLNKLLKKRVYEAHSIATHIYQKNIRTKNLSEVQEMIKEALRPIRFFDGRGYFFAVSMDGVEELYPVKQEFEGQNVIKLQDSKGNFVIRDEINLIKESGEGFVKHYWTKPRESSSDASLKISFVKIFKPLNWYIGTGEYVDEAQKAIQSQVLEHLIALRFETEGYFFGSTFDGDSLFSNGKITTGSDNIWDLADSKGIKIIQEQSKVAKRTGGGFVEYSWPKLKNEEPSPKISFVKGIPEWKWAIGAGVYLDTIESEIVEKKDNLVKKLKNDMLHSFIALTILLCFILIWYRRTSNQITLSTDSLLLFLKKARTKSITIDPDTLQLKEFKKIAVSTNQMLKDRIKAEKSLQLSEQRFKLAMEATMDGLWDWNIQTDEVYYSPGYAAMLGYDSTEIPPHVSSWKDLIHPDDSNRASKVNLGCIENRCNQFKVEFRMRAKNGKWRWILGQGKSVERDNNGRAIRMIGTHTDITVRKSAEQDLRRSEKDLRETQRIAHLGSWRLNVKTNEVFWTKELYKMYGFDPTLPPPPYTEHMKLFTPESWERLSTSLAKTEEMGTPYELELETLKEDGSNGWMWVRGEAVKNSKGKIIGLRGAAQDISNHKRIGLALKESEERFRVLHNASFGGITIHDKGVILECNEGLSKITGYDYDELIGMDGLSLISDDTRNKVVQNIKKGYEKPYEAVGIRKDGNIYPLRLEARNIPYKGRMVRTVEFRDITEQKKAEIEKEKLQTALTQAQKMESVGRLAGGVAHDFNNMPSIILGNTEIVLEDLDSNNLLISNLKEVQKAAQRSTDLTHQLLAFARKQTISPKVLNINHIIDGMLKMLERLIGEDIDISWRPKKGLWPVNIDPSQVDQLLANLCVNARDSIKDVGKITIETQNIRFDENYCKNHSGFIPGDYAEIGISDTGHGMDNATLDNLFEPFFTTKELGEGTGLGLATVYGIVKQNKGFINVYSELEHGTTFRIYLPKHAVGFHVTEFKSAQEKLQKGHETILLVEDEKAILKMTKLMLERLDYTVFAANTPDEAIKICNNSKSKINLLMTDVVMPLMNGRDLSKKVSQSYPEMKCLYMSGYTANVIAHRGILDEGLNFINKPFSKQDLSIKLREILDKK